MITTDFLKSSETKAVYSFEGGKYSVVEYLRDISVNPGSAQNAYFMSEMNVHKRQLAVDLNENAVVIQAGAMQWFAGDIKAGTDIKGAGDLAKKFIGSKVTNETAVKPKYSGSGLLVLEPSYKHLIVCNLDEWNGGVVLEDGLFLACDSTVNMKVVSRKSISSAVLGNEGFFNLSLNGNGAFAIESPVPRDELVVINLNDDTVKIDGPYAIAWSPSLRFTVEKTTKNLIGSAASGEGLVNVYKGTGTVWMAPIR